MKFSGKMSLIFRKDVTENIKSNKKAELHPFSEKKHLWKNHRRSQIDVPQPFLRLTTWLNKIQYIQFLTSELIQNYDLSFRSVYAFFLTILRDFARY